MTSQKQIEANRRNALMSTGPRTPDGKQVVSGNAITHGLRASRIVIDGESEIEFNELRDELIRHIDPVGPLEQLLTDRIIAAIWRLRRAAYIEVELFNYLQQPKPTLPSDPCNNDTQELNPPINCVITKTYPADSSSKRLPEQSAGETNAHVAALKETLKQISCMNVSTQHVPALRQYLTDLSSLDSFINSLSPENRTQLNEAIDELNKIENSMKIQAIDDMHMKFTFGRAMHEELSSRSALTKFHRYESNIERSLFRSLHELQRLQAARLGRDVSLPVALDLNIS